MATRESTDPSSASGGPAAAPRALPTSERESSEHGPLFWTTLGIGGAVMAFAVWGAYDNLETDELVSWGKWVIGLDLFNDLLIVPVALLIALGLRRVCPSRILGPVQAGLAASAVVVLISWPGLMDTAAKTGNPTIQPLNYVTAMFTVLGVVWAVVVGVIGYRYYADRQG